MTSDQIIKSKVVIFSHYATTGACEELRDWLVHSRVHEVVYIAFPFGRNPDRFIRVEHFQSGRLIKTTRSWLRIKWIEPLAYTKDFLYAIYYAMRFGRGADVLVAGDNLLAFSGILAKRLARIRQVVYYMIDYTPVRYANRVLNSLYCLMDRLAAHHADRVWPLTEEMIRARFEAGRLEQSRVLWQVVPYGSHPVSVPVFDIHNVVYMGDVIRSKGADLFVQFALALKQLIPDFSFTVIGGGKDLASLKAEIECVGLQGHVTFCGFVEAIGDVVSVLAKGGVAIAPYDPSDANSFTFYSDPGKIKVYLGCGLPIVLTHVPPIARVISEQGAGKIALYNAVDLAEKVAAVMLSPEYNVIRARAEMMGQEFAWSRIFPEAFKSLDKRSQLIIRENRVEA